MPNNGAVTNVVCSVRKISFCDLKKKNDQRFYTTQLCTLLKIHIERGADSKIKQSKPKEISAFMVFPISIFNPMLAEGKTLSWERHILIPSPPNIKSGW